MVSETKQVIIIALCAIIPNIPGLLYALNSTFRKNQKEWYQNLVFPAGRPPDWVFGPVWVYLYITMGIAHYLVYRTGGDWFTKTTTVPTTVYIIQLLLVSIFFLLNYILNVTLISL